MRGPRLARHFHNKHARSRARHAHCSGSPPRIARSSAGRPRVAHPRTAPWRDGPGTTNRRRNAGRDCPSSPRSGASARCGRKRQSGRSGWRPWRAPARRAAKPPGAPARRRSRRRSGQRTPGRNTRCGWPRAPTDRRRRPWPPPGPPAPRPRCLPASAPAPCRHARGQNRDQQRWHHRRHRPPPGRRSAPDCSLEHRRPVPRRRRWTRTARTGRLTWAFSWPIVCTIHLARRAKKRVSGARSGQR